MIDTHVVPSLDPRLAVIDQVRVVLADIFKAVPALAGSGSHGPAGELQRSFNPRRSGRGPRRQRAIAGVTFRPSDWGQAVTAP